MEAYQNKKKQKKKGRVPWRNTGEKVEKKPGKLPEKRFMRPPRTA